MARRFTDSGTLANYTVGVAGNPAPSEFVSPSAFSSPKSLSCPNGGSLLNPAALAIPNGTGVFGRAYIFIAADSMANAAAVARVLFFAASSGTVGEFYVYGDGTIKIGGGNFAFNYQSEVGKFPFGKWNLVELYARVAAVPAANNGQVEGRLNGESLYAANNLNMQSQIQRIVVGSQFANPCALYFDDVAMNDSTGASDNSWIGPVRSRTKISSKLWVERSSRLKYRSGGAFAAKAQKARVGGVFK